MRAFDERVGIKVRLGLERAAFGQGVGIHLSYMLGQIRQRITFQARLLPATPSGTSSGIALIGKRRPLKEASLSFAIGVLERKR